MSDSLIYSKPVLEFLTVSIEFCATLEEDKAVPRSEWIDKMLKILPLIYIKIQMLPEIIPVEEVETENFVKEEDYDRISSVVANIMRDEDVYLDVFFEEMKYSDKPISARISEDIADIYQDIRNFVFVYQLRLDNQMPTAIYLCRQNFREYWGQKLVNVLRPLHYLMVRDSLDE